MTFERVETQIKRPPLLKERLCLAVILSHLYLHLSGGAWWPYTRTDTMICFQKTDFASLLPLSLPFFPFDTSTGAEHKPDFRLQCINPCMPSLVEFGRFLLEILTWEPSRWEDNDLEDKLRDLEGSDFAIVDRILPAVIACLGYRGEGRLRAQRLDETIRNSERMRASFIEVVIQNLEYVLRVAYRVEADMIFSSAQREVVTRRLKKHDFEHRNIARRKRTEGYRPADINQASESTSASKASQQNHSSQGEEFVLNDDTGEKDLLDTKE
jgi:hypothetical protein